MPTHEHVWKWSGMVGRCRGCGGKLVVAPRDVYWKARGSKRAIPAFSKDARGEQRDGGAE